MFTCPYCGRKYPDNLIEKVARERRREILCPYCNKASEVSLKTSNTNSPEYEYINIAEFLMPYLKIAIPVIFIVIIAMFFLFTSSENIDTKPPLFEMESFFGWWENKESREIAEFFTTINESTTGENPEEPTKTLVEISCKDGIRAGVTDINNQEYVTYQSTDRGLIFVDAEKLFYKGIESNFSYTEKEINSEYSVNWEYAYDNVSKWFSIYQQYKDEGKKSYDGSFGYPKILKQSS